MNVRDREHAVAARLQALAPHLDGEPDPAFRAATRARLVAMAAVRTPAPAPVSPLRRLLTHRAPDAALPRWRMRLTAGLAGAAMAVTCLAGLVAVATGAQPGDPLYDLKRGTEQTQLALAGDATRGQTLLDFAGTRLEELRNLVDDGATALPAAAGGADGSGTTVLAAGADPELVIATIDTMDQQTVEGAAWLNDRAVATGEPGPLEHLAGWAEEQSAGLATLRADVPSAAQDEIDASLVLLADVTTRTAGLLTALDCASGPATDGTDALGPVPAPCAPEGAPPVPGGGTGTPGSPVTTDSPESSATPVPPPVGSGPGVPSVPGLPTSPGGGGGGLPIPSLPLPLPSATVGSPGGGVPTSPPPPVLDLDLCLPPLATLGDC